MQLRGLSKREMQLQTRSPSGFHSNYQMKLLNAFWGKKGICLADSEAPGLRCQAISLALDCQAEKLA
jgi:hypothetical protein